jgi:hypothetical protein
MSRGELWRGSFDPLTAHYFFCIVIFEVCMSAHRYRQLAKECLDRATHARTPEDRDAWLLIAEDWLRLAVEFDAAADQTSVSAGLIP